MKRAIAAILCLLCCGLVAFGQSESGSFDSGLSETANVELSFGPRAGVSFVVMDSKAFHALISAAWPTENWYFPVFTQIGIATTQLIQLGISDASLAFKEIFLLGGMDQNIALPTASLLMGYQGKTGIGLSFGPFVTLGYGDNAKEIKLQFSFAYEVGWTINRKGVSIPISIMFVPMPSYSNPMITVSTGFMFRSD